MNCEQVEELLSAYLDNQLATEERREVATHLHQCRQCSAILTEFRRNDALLRHLPRVSPDPALRERIFSSPEYIELTGTFDARGSAPEEDWTMPNLPARHSLRDTPGRPHLVAIPGGRSTSPNQAARSSGQAAPPIRQSRKTGSSSTQIDRLTPGNVTVASNWAVSPPLPGRSSGDMLAYIDLQQARVHTIRSDGQQDTTIAQPLFKAGVQPTSMWDTTTGMDILNSLAWSVDGSMLAFVADPSGTGQTNLYIYSTVTGTVQVVPLSFKGSATHPVWSPDGVRLAFEVTHDGVISILDYNTQNRGLLTITGNVDARGNAADTILTLDWSPNLDTPTITWSVGVIGHVHSLWERSVGAGETPEPALLLVGDYVQAIYSRNGHAGTGSWLIVTSFAGRAADLWRIDVTPGSRMVPLTSGKQVNYAQWSPNGMHIDYLDALSSGVGTFHVVNVATGTDSLIASGEFTGRQ